MHTTRRPQFFAFAAALVITLSIFSGVSHLAAPSHAGPVLAQIAATAAAHS